jgi:hypothetical protein
MSGPFSSSEGDRADDGPKPEPETPTAETAVLPTSDGDASVPPRPSRAARLRDAEDGESPEDANGATAPAEEAATPEADAQAQAEGEPPAEPAPPRLTFRRKAALRRRARSLEVRRAELLRDLGGLVFELSRAGRERPDLVHGKLVAVQHATAELDEIAAELGGRAGDRPAFAPGLGGECPSCAAVHGAEDAYCSVCGTDLRGAAR